MPASPTATISRKRAASASAARKVAPSASAARFAQQPYRDLILRTPGLVAYWPMDEPAGASSLQDLTGRGHNATVLPGVLTGQPKLVRGASIKGDGLHAGGAGIGQIRVPDHADFDFSGVQELTAECWLKLVSVANQQCFIEQYDPGGGGPPGSFTLRAGTPEAGFPNNKLNGYIITDTAGGADGLGGSSVLPTGLRVHAAITWKRSTTRARLYLNGVLDGERTDITRNVGNSTTTLKLGARGDDEQRHLDGWMDEVAIYARELTADEVRAHYLAGLAGV